MSHKLVRSLVTGIALVCSSLAYAQSNQGPKVEFPDASPVSTVKQRVGLTDFEIVYARPSVKGRQIFGGLQAYGEVWRTGANAATRITFNSPVKFAGTEVPAGTYALFTIPERDSWTVILNKQFEQWGAYRYDASQDVTRVKVPVQTLEKPVETLTIGFDELRDESAVLAIEWEKVRVPVPVQVDVEGKLLPQIEAAMASPEKKSAGLYFNSARYYFDHGKDLNKALTWVNEAIAQNPKAFYMVHLKAKILAKLGQKEEAIAAAKHSMELAEAAKDQSYVRQNKDLISKLQ
jgi:hypothetical protein